MYKRRHFAGIVRTAVSSTGQRLSARLTGLEALAKPIVDPVSFLLCMATKGWSVRTLGVSLALVLIISGCRMPQGGTAHDLMANGQSRLGPAQQ